MFFFPCDFLVEISTEAFEKYSNTNTETEEYKTKNLDRCLKTLVKKIIYLKKINYRQNYKHSRKKSFNFLKSLALTPTKTFS